MPKKNIVAFALSVLFVSLLSFGISTVNQTDAQAGNNEYDYLKNGDFSYPGTSYFTGRIDPDWTSQNTYAIYFDANDGRYNWVGMFCVGVPGYRTVSNYDSNKFAWHSDDGGIWVTDSFYVANNLIELQGDGNGKNTYSEILAENWDRPLYQDVGTEINAKYVWTLRHCNLFNGAGEYLNVIIGGEIQEATRTSSSKNNVNTASGFNRSSRIETTGSGYTSAAAFDEYSAVYGGSYVAKGGTTRFTFAGYNNGHRSDVGNLVDDIGFTIFNPQVKLSYSTTNNKNGGTSAITSAGSSISDDRLSAKAGWNKSVTITSNLSTGYHIESITVDGVKKDITSNTFTLSNCKEDHEVHVTFAPNTYTIKYNTVVENSFGEPTKGSTASSYHAYDANENLTANGFVREGYVFKGWSKTDGGTSVDYADEAIVTNLTDTDGATINLYAVWEPIYQDITYIFDGETLDEKTNIQYGSRFGVPDRITTACTRANCDGIDCWYTDSNFTTKYVTGTRITQDITLYARNCVHIDFDITSNMRETLQMSPAYYRMKDNDGNKVEVTEANVPVPERNGDKTLTLYYGHNVDIANILVKTQHLFAYSAGIEHEFSCDGVWLTVNATGSKYDKTLQLTASKTVYVNWNTGGIFDGSREDWNIS